MTRPRLTVSDLALVGWKEEVRLPALGTAALIAKVDTGARSSALHADEVKIRGRKVLFTHNGRAQELKLLETKRVKSSNGLSELRPVVEIEVELGRLCFVTPVTLTNRTGMDVPMLLGREAIKGRFLVNAARAFMQKLKRPRA